jgi:transposase
VKHIHRRNIKFKNEISIADKSKILGVAIDPAKSSHRVIIFNFKGRIIIPPFSISTFQDGYEALKKKIKLCSKKINSRAEYIAIEGSASYSENLIRHLRNDFTNVVFIAPSIVSANRTQRLLQGLKTDDLDAGAVADLLIRGEFKDFATDSGIYYKLKELVYWREGKLNLLIAARNQIIHRLEKIYPGLNTAYMDQKKLYSCPEVDVLLNGILKVRKTGQCLLATHEEVLFKEFGYKDAKGLKRIAQLKAKLKGMLLPDERVARTQLRMLKRDVGFLRYVEKNIREVEKEMVTIAKNSPAKYIMNQVKGVGDIQAAIFIGLIGNIKGYSDASEVYAKSGLCPKMHQSGMQVRSNLGIRRTGSQYLRTHLFRMATLVAISEPIFRDYNARKRADKGRHWKKNRIAVANKLNRVLFALMRDKVPFRRVTAEPLENSNHRVDEKSRSSSECSPVLE